MDIRWKANSGFIRSHRACSRSRRFRRICRHQDRSRIRVRNRIPDRSRTVLVHHPYCLILPLFWAHWQYIKKKNPGQGGQYVKQKTRRSGSLLFDFRF